MRKVKAGNLCTADLKVPFRKNHRFVNKVESGSRFEEVYDALHDPRVDSVRYVPFKCHLRANCNFGTSSCDRKFFKKAHRLGRSMS